MAWKGFYNIPVSYDYAHRHYEPATYRVTGTLSASGLTDSSTYYFYVDYLFSGQTVPARTGRSVDITYASTFALTKANAYFAPSETYPDVVFNNPSVSVTSWGSKATATASLSKTSGFVDPSNPGTVTAQVTTTGNCFTAYSVSSGTFYYKKSTASSYSTKAFTGTSISLANLFQIGNTYNVYVSEVLDDGTTVTSPTYTYSTEDGAAVVTPTAPLNVNVYGSAQFQWQYSNSRGTRQYAFDIQTSPNGSTWTNVANHIVSSSTSYTATLSTPGILYWRVRAYNQENVAGSWSSVNSFVNIIPPSAPTFSGIEGTGRITVSWNSSGQTAYQVMIGSHDSGWVYSTDKSYFLNEYLQNGNYTIRVRIANNIGLISSWSTMTYTQNIDSAIPVATVTMKEGFNELDIAGNFSKIYILRNGVPVAETVAGIYADYYCNGSDAYIIRGVNSDDTFGDLEIEGNYTCRKPAVITPNRQIIYVNERLDEQPSISSSVTMDVVAANYLGRTTPVHHVGTMKTRSWTVTCAQQIEVGQVYFYRNFRGDKAWVICSNVQSALNWFGVHEYQYTLEETDYNEAIEYEV